jgi:hypothetical protein
MAETMAYEDPNSPLHPKKPFASLLKIFSALEKKPPRHRIPLTQKNLEQYSGLDCDYSDIHDAFLPVRARGKISVSEWLQLLP